MYENLRDAKAEDFTPFRNGEGVTHLGREYILYGDVDYGYTEDNPCRLKGSNKKKVVDIAASRKQGIVTGAELPCVTQADKPGKYKGQNGMTRMKADRDNGWYEGEGAWMDIVRFESTRGRTANYNKFVYLHNVNDPLPNDPNSVDDIVRTCGKLIESGDLALSLDAVENFVYESVPNMGTTEKNQAIRRVVEEEQVPTTTIPWKSGEARRWMDEDCLDKDIDIDYFFATHHFQSRAYAVIKQYHESGDSLEDRSVQEVAQFFDNRGDSDEAILKGRIEQEEDWEELRLICKSLAIYMVANDWQLPFSRRFAVPQIKSGKNKERQDKLVRLFDEWDKETT